MHLSDEQKEIIVDCLTEHLDLSTIILFGSAAKGKLRHDSDVDLAVITKQSYGPYELFIIAQKLAEKLNREVDLIRFDTASPVLQTQILAHKEILLDLDSTARQYMFMRALKEYAMLNEERKAILQKFGYTQEGEGSFDDGRPVK